MRTISDKFVDQLQQSDGLLFPLFQRIIRDDTLEMAIRKDYINIYYRGGNLLRLTEKRAGSYRAEFDTKYNIFDLTIPIIPTNIDSPRDVSQWLDAFPILKQMMDFFLSSYRKPEREFQQLVMRENNNSTISNETEYFITDIEFADPGLGARFDMLAIQWLKTARKNDLNCTPVLIEKKYGDGALSGTAGILKHLEDIDALVSNNAKYQLLLETMESQFNLLNKLGMLKCKGATNSTCLKLSADKIPEVIFLFANHNPRSQKLKKLLQTPEVMAYAGSSHFNLRFSISSFAGYGLHTKNMLDLDAFLQFL